MTTNTTYVNDFTKMWFKLSKEMKIYMEQQLSPQLTEGQLNVLEFLLERQPERIKPSDLIQFLATTPAAITTLIDRMEKNELIRRERDEEDRRIVWITLTTKGVEEGHRGIRIRQQFIHTQLDRISTHNQQLFIYLLGKVTNL